MRANIPSDKKMGDFLLRKISRRKFLIDTGMMISFFGGLKFTSGCATPDFQKKESTVDLQASQNRDLAIDNIYKINLGVKQNEKVLVFTDDHSPIVQGEAEYVAKRGANFGQIIFHQYPKTGLSGAEPPRGLWEKAFGKSIIEEIEKRKLFRKLLEKKISEKELESIGSIVRQNEKDVVQVVIGLAWFSTSHTSFRKLLTNYAGVRYASMPGFDPRMWQTAMLANWEEVDRRTNSLQQKISGLHRSEFEPPMEPMLVLFLREENLKLIPA